MAAPATAQPGEDVTHGMVGLPSSNVDDAVPDHAEAAGAPPADAFRGSVMTSRHAESLSVQVTTRASLEGRENACLRGTKPDWCSSPEVALVLEDSANHDGRTVSVPKAPVVENLGDVPELVYIEHSSGREYEAQVTDTGDQLAFHVDEFSTNEITFSGEVSLQGNPATNGAQYQYNISSLDSVSNFSVDVTGATQSASTSTSGTFDDGDTVSLSTGGNLEPSNAQITVSEGGYQNETVDYGHNYAQDGADAQWTHYYDGYRGALDEIMVRTDPSWQEGSYRVIVYVAEGNVGSDVFTNGEQVADNTHTSGYDHFNYGTPSFDAVDTGVTIGVQIREGTSGINYVKHTRDKLWVDPSLDTTSISGSQDSVSITGEGSASINLAADDSLTFSGSAVGQYNLSWTEHTETRDPTVEVNGQTTSCAPCTLSDGETQSLSVDPAWIREGINRVNISVGDGSAGTGPAPATGFSYSHTAGDRQTVEFDGATWTERYNVSHTYASDRANAEVTIPFASDRVVAVRDAEYRLNGGQWQQIDEASRSFDGAELTLEVGTVPAGDEVQVRANASKVRVYNGEMTVLKPTIEGNALQTKIELSSWASDSHIDVSGTHPDKYLHHAENESWQSPTEYSTFRPGGQTLHFPGASSGATARIVTLPMAVDTTGDVEIEVRKAGFSPRFKVRPGDAQGDSVSWSWEHSELATGTEYLLYSPSHQKLVDSDTAQSPVFFESSDEEQTLEIQEDYSTSTSGGDGGGGGMWQDASGTVREYAPIVPPEIVLVAGLLLFAVGAAYSERRSPDRTVYKRPFFVTGALAGVAVVVLFLAPQAVFNPLETALQATLPLLGLGAVGFTGLIAYGWYQRQQNEGKPPTIEVMGRQK